MRSVVGRFFSGIGVMLLFTLSFSKSPAFTQIQDNTIGINEYQADPATGLSGDANRDGVGDVYEDEFVEMVNVGTTEIDISGWTLSDSVAVRHIFPANTSLQQDCGIVVFGGGMPSGNFGDSIVQVASTGGLSLNNASDSITLKNGEITIATYEYSGASSTIDQSVTRYPDLIFTFDFVPHTYASGTGALFSPGTTIAGDTFDGDCPEYIHYLYLPVVSR